MPSGSEKMADPICSFIIPVYNRPDELNALLESLACQTLTDFEVIVVDDGSTMPSEPVVTQYKERLDVQYHAKKNEGPGPARNYGCRQARSDLFVFLDSDCLVPPDYVKNLAAYVETRTFDAFGGPDRAHSSFNWMQKAVNYSMTSFLTTGGIRGKKESMEKFKPRSFNMGIMREVFKKTSGFSTMRYGEDIDLSLRIERAGFQSVLLPACYVYHRRRANLIQFFRQVMHSGEARIDLSRRHRGSLKIVHLLPAIYLLLLISALAFSVIRMDLLLMYPFFGYWALIFLDGFLETLNPVIALLCVITGNVQLLGYGSGFLRRWITG